MTDSDKDNDRSDDPALVRRLMQWNGRYSHGRDATLTFSVTLRLPLGSYDSAKGLYHMVLRNIIDHLFRAQHEAVIHQHSDPYSWRTAHWVIADQLATQLADALYLLTGVRAMVEQADIGHQPEMSAKAAAVP